MSAGEELIELRANSRGQHVVLREPAGGDNDFYTRLALVPKLALIAGFTLAYWLCPFDVIPDMIPVLGMLDDSVVGMVGLLAGSQSWQRLRQTRSIGLDGFIRP